MKCITAAKIQKLIKSNPENIKFLLKPNPINIEKSLKSNPMEIFIIKLLFQTSYWNHRLLHFQRHQSCYTLRNLIKKVRFRRV